MRRSIQFSTNHLAVSLRKLSVLNDASLVDHMVVIIEFRVGIGGKRVDAVLAINTGDTSTPLAMYAIEMKAWSPAFKDTFEMIEQSIGNDLFPSSVRYKAKKGRAYQSPNPVMQVRGYIQDLQFEFGSKVHGCAWLHNIQDRLSTPFDKLAIQKHITMAKISIGTKIPSRVMTWTGFQSHFIRNWRNIPRTLRLHRHLRECMNNSTSVLWISFRSIIQIILIRIRSNSFVIRIPLLEKNQSLKLSKTQMEY